MGAMLGIDVGGTFTDFFEIGKSGQLRILKVPSVPDQPADGVMAGLTELASGQGGLQDYLSQLELIVHGTTITTNAIITGTHAKTGYVTTKGFRDILNSRRGLKRRAFTAKEAPPKPIVPRYLIRTIDERLDKTGAVIRPLDEADVRAAAAHFRGEQVEAVAVCTMFSFLNPVHELRIKEILEEELPEVYVTISSKVLPQMRFYERGSTTVFNACVGPLLRNYIDALLARLGSYGFRGRFLTMQSNGGVMPPEAIRDFAANTLLSGPASAPVAGLFFARDYRFANLITMDMGGTSFDACLISDGRPAVTGNSEVAEYALALPALDIKAIGAGGGSIASATGGNGLLQVGPDSAGARPGPVCYGQGGTEPTVTDANLVLGFLDPEYFLGGVQKLDREAARHAIGARIADPLGLSVKDAALGVIRIVDANMAEGVRGVSIARGFDPRDACLVAAGGAGPLHACGIAQELGMELVLIPRASSVFCASGMLTTDLRQDVVRHASIRLDDADSAVAAINNLRETMIAEGEAILAGQSVPSASRSLEFTADMLFIGQFNVLETRLPMLDEAPVTGVGLVQLRDAFRKAHEGVYGYVLEDETVEIRSLRLAAIGRTGKPQFPRLPPASGGVETALKSRRPVWFGTSDSECPVYDGEKLESGHEIEGPALIEHATTTIKISPGWRGRADDIGNLLMWRNDRSLSDVLARLQHPKSEGQA